MDLGRTPPPFFKQGPSALSRLAFFSALALLLMVADVRFKVTEPLRRAVATVLYPAEVAVQWPIERITTGKNDLQALREAQAQRDQAIKAAQALSLRAQQVELLQAENTRLREIMALRTVHAAGSVAAEIVYETRDPFSRRFVLNKGTMHGIVPGMPIIDELGIVGQVTRSYITSSEVSAITDKAMAIPVQNSRTGVRGVAYGDEAVSGALELRFTAANADVQVGDVLVTSGLDGVYPSGLHVAKIVKVERRADTTFARIICAPLSGLDRGRHVLAIAPVPAEVPRPLAAPIEAAGKDGRGRRNTSTGPSREGATPPASAASPATSGGAR